MIPIPTGALLVLLLGYLPPALVLSAIDAREHRLPNRLLGRMSGGTLGGLLLVAAAVPAQRGAVRTALVLGLVAGVAAVVLALVAPSLLGMGDAKALPAVVAVSAALGGEVLIGGLLAAAVLAGLAGAMVLAVARRGGVRFPLGPILLAAPFLGIVAAPLVRQALGG